MKVRWMAAGCVLLALAGCNDGTGSEQRAPAKLEVTAGDAQNGTAGAALAAPVAATVTDGRGRPLANQVVSFAVLSGGGSVGAAAVTTGTDGTARTVWTLGGAAGEQRLEARLVPAAGATTFADTARATAGPAAAAAVVAVSPAAVTDTAGRTLADSVAVRVRDAFGNPVPGVTVTFTATGGGTVSPATAVSRADGTAKTVWTLGTTPGTQTVQASAAGASPATLTATALPRNRLELVVEVPGRIVDGDGARVLWIQGDPIHSATLIVRTLSTGADQLVYTAPVGGGVSQAFLTPFGAVFAANSPSLNTGVIWEWRGGAPAIIGYFTPVLTLRAAGNYALWMEGPNVRVRDLATGVLTTPTSDARTFASVAPNGAAAWATRGAPNRVELWTGGTPAVVGTSIAPYVHINPLTDGSNVVFLSGNPSNGQHIALVLRTPTATDTLAITNHVQPVYSINNGWVVWSTPDGTFRRSPAGATSLANTWTAVIEALAPDGSLLARVNPYGLGPLEHQLTLPGGTAETLGPAHVTDSGFFANGAAYVIKGGSLYRARP